MLFFFLFRHLFRDLNPRLFEATRLRRCRIPLHRLTPTDVVACDSSGALSMGNVVDRIGIPLTCHTRVSELLSSTWQWCNSSRVTRDWRQSCFGQLTSVLSC